MKFNVTIELDSKDNIYDFQTELIKESAKQLINEQYSNYDNYGKTYREKVRSEVKKTLLECMDENFKEDVKIGVINELSKRFARTKQSKMIVEEFNIQTPDKKNILNEIVREIVKEEIKSRFR